METNLANFTDILSDEIPDSQPLSLSINNSSQRTQENAVEPTGIASRPQKHTGQHGEFRSIEEIDPKYREVFSYPFFNLVQSRVIEDAVYSDKSIVVCAPTGSGKTVVFEMAIVQLLMEIDDKKYDKDFKIIYMAPVKALCTERLTEWYSKFTKLGLLCIEVTGDTDVDFSHLKPYRVIITTPEKWDMLTRRWRDHRGLVELIKLFLIDEVHILNDENRGPVLEAVVSRMKTIESSTQSEYRIEQLQKQYNNSLENPSKVDKEPPPRIRFVAVSATVSNPEDVATWLGNSDKPAVFYKFGDECRPVKLKRVVEGYPCPDGTSIFKFDIILNYKLWPIIQRYHDGKPTLIFCNTRKSVTLTAEALSREITISFNPEQRAKLTAIAATIKNKKLQSLVMAGVGCHHAGLLYEERLNIEKAFRNRDLPILITTTTLAMGVNLPAHLVIIKNTQQYVNGAYQEYSISTVLQMVGRAGRPQFDMEATAVIMTRISDKPRYEALVCGSDPLQSYLHKRLPENLNSEAALGTVNDVAQCVQWLRSTFLYVRAARDPKRYLGLPNNAPRHLISKKIEELCVRAMNGLASSGLISMDEASCIESTEAGRLMSIFYLDLETMKQIMKIEGTATLEKLLGVVCESHELADMHLRVDERRCLNALNRNNAAPTIRFPMKGKISSRQMKLNCVIQAVLGCLPIPDASLNQEAMKIMRIADRVCKCLVAYVTRPGLVSGQPTFFNAVLNSIILSKCIAAHIWENSPYVSKQLKGIGPTFSTLLATAGKINFMLLEESHPRDLERIMNKGPPAGNVLRKQISLLPKYQITMTPVDEKVVTMQLSLLNHNYLAENMEDLTAGERHKSYIIAGDSKNHLLLLTSFKDKDLIGMYDGIISHQIERKHSFEHKIMVHCVSSMFVGIDAQCEYVFKDIEPAPMNVDLDSFYFNNDTPTNKTIQKQTFITDIYKERKRKNKCDSEISQSKEKKKRESALAEKIRFLKESFGRASKKVKVELHKSDEVSNKVVDEILNIDESIPLEVANNAPFKIDKITENGISYTDNNVNNFLENVNCEDFDNNEYIDDTKIKDILNDIESEIYKEDNIKDSDKQCYNKNVNLHTRKRFEYPQLKGKKLMNVTKPKNSNFNFLGLLDKNVDLNEEEDNKFENDAGFSNTIKSQVNKYLQQTQNSSKTSNIIIDKLIGNARGRTTEEIVHEANTDINLPLVNLNIKILNENKNTLRKESIALETAQNIIDLTKNEDSCMNNKHNKIDLTKNEDTCMDHTKTKPDFRNMQELIPRDTSILSLDSPNTKLKEIDIVDHTSKIDDIISNQYSNNSIKYALHDTVRCNDIKDSNLASIENKNDTYEYNGCKMLVQSNHSNRDKTEHNIPVIENNCKNGNQIVSKTVHDERHIDQHSNFENSNDLNSKRSYVKNYSYSALNVDISTSHSSDRHVHIIKKIKVDLDVTEIVTHDNIKQDTSTVHINCEDTSTLTPVAQSLEHSGSFEVLEPKKNCLVLRPQENVTPLNKPSPISQDTKFINSQVLRPIAYYQFNKYDQTLNNKNERIESCNNNLNITNKTDIKMQVFEPIACLSSLQRGKSNRDNKSDNTHCVQFGLDQSDIRLKETDISQAIVISGSTIENKSVTKKIQSEEKYLKNEMLSEASHARNIVVPEITATKILEANIKEPISIDGGNSKNNESKLEDILQKYSQVFRKIKKEDDKMRIQTLQSNSERPGNTQINKRPFKITDIDKIQPKLPSMLTAETVIYTTPPQNMEVTVDANKVVPHIPAIITIIETTGVSNIQQSDDIVYEEELEPLTPIASKDLITNEYKIDDSMLNPRTLLQCLIKDEPEIIPPPPEFSDLNYSPSQSVENDEYSKEPINDIAILDNDKNLFNHSYVDSDESSLHNSSSNEIETLLLSNEDYPERRPWTITHSFPSTNVPGRTCNTVTRSKLDHFKFMNKKKFKIK